MIPLLSRHVLISRDGVLGSQRGMSMHHGWTSIIDDMAVHPYFVLRLQNASTR